MTRSGGSGCRARSISSATMSSGNMAGSSAPRWTATTAPAPSHTRLPLWLFMALGYANLAIYILLGCTVFPPSLALSLSLVDFTQRSYTFRSDRAARDFGYAQAETVLDAIKRLAVEEAARRKQA